MVTISYPLKARAKFEKDKDERSGGRLSRRGWNLVGMCDGKKR